MPLAETMSSPYFNIKRKLFLSLYVYPFLVGAFILFAKFTFWPSVNPFLVPVMWGTILLISLLIQKRFVSAFQVHAEEIQVTYLTPFLIEKEWAIDLHLVSKLKIEKGILGGFSTLNIITKSKWHSFDVYNKAMLSNIKQQLASANRTVAIVT
jgi:hypothetical protein